MQVLVLKFICAAIIHYMTACLLASVLLSTLEEEKWLATAICPIIQGSSALCHKNHNSCVYIIKTNILIRPPYTNATDRKYTQWPLWLKLAQRTAKLSVRYTYLTQPDIVIRWKSADSREKRRAEIPSLLYLFQSCLNCHL